jgi:hypothetical protein
MFDEIEDQFSKIYGDKVDEDDARIHISSSRTATTSALSLRRTWIATTILPFRITSAEGECDRLGSMRLLPGMPVECFVQTGDRVVLCYLTKPLVDQVMRAFRQD